MRPITPGTTFVISYPFVREKLELLDEDGFHEVPTWNPGVRYEMSGPEDVEAVADGSGEAIFNVIDVHKPGRYPTRVFYTRRWRTPDGKEFGKSRLHIATLEKFRRLIRGYQHEFVLRKHEEAAA